MYRGRRDCESRWKVLKAFLERYQHTDTFHVLDFGANFGYFSWRIHEDYPNAVIDVVDSREILKILWKVNDTNNMTQYDNMNTDMIRKHGETHHYDVILLFSILHHFDNYPEVLDIFREMGDTVIVEIDSPDHANFKGNQQEVYQHIMTLNPIQLNQWIPHDRPIYYLNDNENSIEGVIGTGGGIAQKSMPALNRIFKWLGVEMYPGTLNVHLDHGIYFNRWLYIGGYVFGEMFLNGLPVLAIRDTNLKINPNRLELISPYRLRDYFDLEDGNRVVVSFNKENAWQV